MLSGAAPEAHLRYATGAAMRGEPALLPHERVAQS
jgi:hypothetical protein